MADDLLDPAALVEAALVIVRQVEGEPEIPNWRALRGFAHATALAQIAQAAALLQPSPEEVLAVYQETRAEVLGEEAEKAATARQILQEAARDGSRRHPAIHAALEALGDG